MRKEYYEAHKEEIKKKHHEYYLKHKEETAQRAKEWAKNNPEKVKEHQKRWNKNNKEKKLEYQREWRKTQYGRATMILSAYIEADKNMGREQGDLTPQWIVDNIFTKPCPYCGETDWTKIGCNRLDNSKPHTKDNVEPCCGKCNQLLQKQPRNEKGQFRPS